MKKTDDWNFYFCKKKKMERLQILKQTKHFQTKFLEDASQAQILSNMWKQLKIWTKKEACKRNFSYTDKNEYYTVSFLLIV